MIRANVTRTIEQGTRWWTIVVASSEHTELLHTFDLPYTEAGRVAALTVAHAIVNDMRLAEGLVEELDGLRMELHYERTGECPGCRGTGITGPELFRCGYCDGRGYHEPPIVAEHRKLDQTVRMVKRWTRANEAPTAEEVTALRLLLMERHPAPDPTATIPEGASL